MTKLEEYYNKFNEEKRLLSRHGQVEYRISMHYIHCYLEQIQKKRNCKKSEIAILDIGAGTGRYSVALSEEGYTVTAIEPVKYNLGILKKKQSNVTALWGNALNLKKIEDGAYDLVLLFGPMYHLFTEEDKCRALMQAKRKMKDDGFLFVAYVMNEYAVITYAFKERHIMECLRDNKLDANFLTQATEEDLYDYVRIEQIDEWNATSGLVRDKILSCDGATEYIRPVINELTEEEFEAFLSYQLAVCERKDLLGAGAHIVDILQKKEK